MSDRMSMAVRTELPSGAELGVVPASAHELDVRAYLASRQPCPHPDREMDLFVTLPEEVRHEVDDLLSAFATMLAARSLRQGAQIAAREALARGREWSAERLRHRLALYQKTQDWMCLVNRAKAGVAWQDGSTRGLPPEFVRFAAQRFAAFRRSTDGGRAAIRSIKEQWRTGRDRDGRLAPIPGYGFWQDWWAKEFPGTPLPPVAPVPTGWSEDNIRRKARLAPAVKALCHEGIGAARKLIPGVARTRVGLRFLELIECDDVKVDFRVFDPATGQVMDLWLLVARDKATGLLLGYGMRPARVREDGTQEHLRLIDMKQLLGGILERWGIPCGYVMTFQLENGTATLPVAVAQALGHTFNGRINVVFARMIVGNSPVGYAERGKGNSNSKSSLESMNRMGHTDTADLPGQTGRRYDLRPADLGAREKEAVATWQTAAALPEHLRSKTGYPLLTLTQAREHLMRIFRMQNEREDHELEGFEQILEWRPNPSSAWAPANTAPADLPPGAEIRQRKERPSERAESLARGVRFDRVPPVAFKVFYEHTQRLVKVGSRGEIGFAAEKRELVFRDARPDGGLPPGSQWLAYHHPEDPALLHLLHPRTGAYVATWVRRERVGWSDPEALAAAIRYTEAALAAQRQVAEDLVSPEREERQARLEGNAALVTEAEFLDVTPLVSERGGFAVTSPSAIAMQSAREERAERREARARQDRQEGAAAANDILAGRVMTEEAEEISQAGDSLLAALGRTNPED